MQENLAKRGFLMRFLANSALHQPDKVLTITPLQAQATPQTNRQLIRSLQPEK